MTTYDIKLALQGLAEVEAQLKSGLKSIEDAATSTGKAVDKAVKPLENAGSGQGLKSLGTQLKGVAGEAKSLYDAVSNALGGGGLGGLVDDLKPKLTALRAQLTGLGVGGTLAAGGAMLGVLGLGIAGNGLYQAHKQNQSTLEFGNANNEATLKRLNTLLNNADEAGSLPPEALGSAKKRLEGINSLQSLLNSPAPLSADAIGAFSDLITPEILKKMFGPGTDAKLELQGEIARESSRLLTDIRKQTQASLATRMSGEVALAQQQREVTESKLDTLASLERAELDQTMADRTKSEADQIKVSELFTVREKAIIKDRLEARLKANNVAKASAEELLKKAQDDPEAAAQISQTLRTIETQTDLDREHSRQANISADQEAAARRLQIFENTNQRIRRELQAEADAQRAIDQRGTLDKARIEADFTRTSAEKLDQRIAVLDRENTALDEQLKKLRERAAYERGRGNVAGADILDNSVRDFQSRRDANQVEGIGLRGQADPNSVREQMVQANAQLRESFGTTAQQIAQVYTSVIGSAVSSISNGLTGLIMQTMTWRQALLSIGTTILTTIVSSIVQMGVRWILTHTLMAGVAKALAAASLAANIPIAAAQASIWATPAALATVASFGGAAAAAPGQLALAIGAAQLEALGSFDTGGYTGDGPRDQVAGVVHRRELVLDADATAQFNPAQRAMLQRGEMPMQLVNGPATAANGPTFKQAVFFDPALLQRYVAENLDAHVLRVFDEHRHLFE